VRRLLLREDASVMGATCTGWLRGQPALLVAAAIGVVAVVAACGDESGRHMGSARASTASPGVVEQAAPPDKASVRLLFGGDLMLGRGVEKAAAPGPAGPLTGIRLEVTSAGLAVANLESPLTRRPHDPASGPNALEAPPASARFLAAAGFDAMGIANNHAGDAGPETVADTMRALSAAGIATVGAGQSAAGAFAPRIVRVAGVRIALLSLDATGQGPRAAVTTPGVAWWDEPRVRAAVLRARLSADIVAVGVHGGAEYVPESDPAMVRIARLLASWGADVVWGTGSHVVQPVHVIDPDKDGRPTVVTTSLGNLLFDQHIPGTQRGALLEVLVRRDGVRALRVGVTRIAGGRVLFRAWRAPSGNAAVLGAAWWTPTRPVTPIAVRHRSALPGFPGDVVDAAIGDANGDGRPDVAVSFRRPFSPTNVSGLVGRQRLVDQDGHAAHVGVYRPRDLRPRWVAGTVLRPVAALAPCDGTLAVAYSTLDDLTVVGTGAWRWSGFGFTPLPDLLGSGVPGCADVDGDGRLDAVILERS
jgi:poly-gamma-glutamate synthesis protein (capsule biosynthesis protein)